MDYAYTFRGNRYRRGRVMAYITIRIADDKVEELLNHKEDEERYLKVKNDYFVFDIVSVDKEPTEKEKLAKENHALRRAWSPSR